MIAIIAQVAVFLFGAGAVLLIGAFKSKWGFALGLAAQPAWFYIAVTARQWGILAVSAVYTANWAIGFYNWFAKSPVTPRGECARCRARAEATA